jgi:hypothetical protein
MQRERNRIPLSGPEQEGLEENSEKGFKVGNMKFPSEDINRLEPYKK